ncbi:protein peste-like isoform X2 [Macrosteles quadrilineatus]|nr:protein peste-like isoform X2 [Macrosteles quadrilineatus]XP_054264336.1 protein peste-like isoform X2 [Macrosteles quadrilineatus]XP_054264337.1 protein peste-like isoform X2 [Macrosteles quadrilineatus]XP_054264338.1 protein peste-like isoform X2 [Macrosteles quadrilineatus]
MRNLLAPSCGILFSSVLIVTGLFFLFIFPSVLEYFANKEFLLSPNSQSFKHWKKTPLPISLDFYLFNWTNPHLIDKEKPKFTELGPYRFYETREKSNISWNKNGTVSYRQRRTWFFDESSSNGTQDDVISTINGVTLTAAYMVRHSGYLPQQSLNMAFTFTKQKISVSHTVRELLFDGYENNLMSLANKLSPSLTPMSSPFDKFAWFYQRNDSYAYDGWFNLDTGEKDISQLGVIKSWNGKINSGFYSGKCGEIKGFTGDLFPPGYVGRDTRLNLFSQDLCRTLPFDYTGNAEVEGIQGLRYTAGLHLIDNGSLDPDNSCYCNGECVPPGFLNLTSCRFGAPVFVSYPHFHQAHPVFLKRVEGLEPDPERHEFYFSIEPTYGVPIDIGARVQLNMLMQPIPHISMYKNVPRVMFPVLWVDQRVTISEALAWELRLVLLLPTLATIAGVFALSSGTILFVILLALRSRRKNAEKEGNKPC